MNKIYKYSMNTNVADSKGHIRKFLTEHDIKFSSEILIVFEIADNDPRFVDVSKFMSTYRINPRIRLEYSKKELGEAQYLRMAKKILRVSPAGINGCGGKEFIHQLYF